MGRPRAARAATDAPLLAKGFFSTADDLRTAKEAGADAALLLLRDLDDAQVAALLAEAERLGLDTLVEAHDADELDRGIALGAPVLGVNARDLATFEIDRRAPSSSSSRGIPADRVVIAESGIHSRAQGAAAELAGADAILVGSALMRAPIRPRSSPSSSRGRSSRSAASRARRTSRSRRRRAPTCSASCSRRRARARPSASCPSPTRRSPSPSGSARPASRRPTSTRCTRSRPGKVRGRDATLYRGTASPSRGCSTSPGARTTRATGSARPRPRAGSSSPAGSGRRTSPRIASPPAPWAVDASSSLETSPGDQGPRPRAGVRRGGPRDDGARGDLRPVRRALRPGDADPGARRADRRLGGGEARPGVRAELDELGRTYVGRPSPITLASRFAPGKRLYLKREDLNHTGAHKINNALGQVVLARRLGKRRIIAETGAGQHGVATATACARFGLECVVYMGSGGHAPPGAQRRADAPPRRDRRARRVRHADAQGGDERRDPRLDHERRDDPLRDRLLRRPAPYPELVRELQAVIGREAREQLLEAEGASPRSSSRASAAARTRSGCSPASSTTPDVRLVGVEAAGAASLGTGRAGVLHGSRSSILADEDGQIADAHSISAGLDYPGVGPEHAWLRDTGRATYLPCTDEEALDGVRAADAHRGDHPRARVRACARGRRPARRGVRRRLPLGRGDKDLAEALAALDESRA